MTQLTQFSLSLPKTLTLYETHPSLHIFHMDLHQQMACWRSAVITLLWCVRCTQSFRGPPSASSQIHTSGLRLVCRFESSAFIQQEGHLFSSSSSVRWIWVKGQISLHQKSVWPSQLEMGRDRWLYVGNKIACWKLMRGRGGKTEVNDRGVERFSPPAFSHVPQAQLNTNVSMHEIETNIRNVSSDPCPLFPFLFLSPSAFLWS